MISPTMPTLHRSEYRPPRPSIERHGSQIPPALRALASDHEFDELQRYRQLAFAFLTFDTATSRLMAALGIECEMRLEALAGHRAEPVRVSSSCSVKRMARSRAAPCRAFIDSTATATQALNQAIHDAAASHRLYDSALCDYHAVVAIYPVLKAIVRQKQAELQILQEHRINREAPPPDGAA